MSNFDKLPVSKYLLSAPLHSDSWFSNNILILVLDKCENIDFGENSTADFCVS